MLGLKHAPEQGTACRPFPVSAPFETPRAEHPSHWCQLVLRYPNSRGFVRRVSTARAPAGEVQSKPSAAQTLPVRRQDSASLTVRFVCLLQKTWVPALRLSTETWFLVETSRHERGRRTGAPRYLRNRAFHDPGRGEGANPETAQLIGLSRITAFHPRHAPERSHEIGEIGVAHELFVGWRSGRASSAAKPACSSTNAASSASGSAASAASRARRAW